ncbi:MAG: HEAT repeat domain-containing protein, partial [Planctomycetes bacterium]|nr:HEAT repeat domain-containing protein [Planctomycetota bacterium]
MVRSCAVAALGQTGTPTPRLVEDRLIDALRDADMRVRANAVESLQRRDTRSALKQIERFVNHSHNRIRANSIWTLLHWKVKSAPNALARMLADERPLHRQSAQWVLQAFQNPDGNPAQEEIHKSNERNRHVAPLAV